MMTPKPLDPELRARLRNDFNTEPMDSPSSPLDIQVNGSHYKDFVIQPAEFCERNKLPFLDGSVIKRLCRHGSKDGVEDLRKAIHEIQLIAHLRYGVTL